MKDFQTRNLLVPAVGDFTGAGRNGAGFGGGGRGGGGGGGGLNTTFLRPMKPDTEGCEEQ